MQNEEEVFLIKVVWRAQELFHRMISQAQFLPRLDKYLQYYYMFLRVPFCFLYIHAKKFWELSNIVPSLLNTYGIWHEDIQDRNKKMQVEDDLLSIFSTLFRVIFKKPLSFHQNPYSLGEQDQYFHKFLQFTLILFQTVFQRILHF